MNTILIRADCTQVGLLVEASQDEGKTWQCVQIARYQERSRPGFGNAQFIYINPSQDRADYFAELDKRGIAYKVATL
jgi:hypothetical protein